VSGFSFNQTTVSCDGISLAAIADKEGTPLYVYSAALIRERYAQINHAFGDHPHRVHYALKANSTLAIARLLQDLGGGVDANSGGEIAVALRAGFEPCDIVFTGVGKTEAELEQAVALGVHTINAESAGELERIDRLACAHGRRARVALRVNPNIDAVSHPNISTGCRSHKFGVPLEQALAVCRQGAARDGLQLVGLHFHIGSQMLVVDPIRRAAATAARLAQKLLSEGIQLEHLDLGGGLGISYDGSTALDAGTYARVLLDEVASTKLNLIVEPGRWIVGPAGVLVARVVDVKRQDVDRYFVVLDAGMSELMRPALYKAFHQIRPLSPGLGDMVTCDVVGPICETSDVMGIGRTMPLPEVGDLLAVLDTGAYGAAMASNYNRHPLPAEVMVEEGRWRVVRRRQTVDDLLAQEE
jgi:diaminopimelate decarboxylase